jgi:hypothetical protein
MASAIIESRRTISGNQPAIRRINEKAAQTFLNGVPVMLDLAVGAVQEWDGTTIANGIAGFSKSPAANLAATGTAKTLTTGRPVPYQPAAQDIVRGAPINDGRVDFEVANDDTVFYAQVGPAQVTAATDVGKQYGMTKDSDGHWYVDKTKSTIGTNTMVQVVKLDPNDAARGVHIVVTRGQSQVLA